MKAPDAKITKMLLFFAALAVLPLVFGGCGYSTSSLLPAHLKTIYVDNFKNKIDIGKEVTEGSRYTLYRPGLENDITNAVVSRFVFDGNLKIERREKADLVLKGDLVDYRQEALGYDSDDNVEEYRISVLVDIELNDVAKDKFLWKRTGFSGETTYKTTGRSATSEDDARDEAIEDLSRRIVEKTVENW